MELLNRRREMGSHLPYDYEVEYLEGDGYAYIDTGVIPLITDYVYIEFYLVTPFSTADASCSIYGVMKAWQTNAFAFALAPNKDRIYALRGSRTPPEANIHFPAVQNSWQTQIMNNTIFQVFGRTLNAFGSNSPCLASAYLFCIHIGESGFYGRGTSKRIRKFQHKRDGELIVDYIPVVKDNVGYMYDKVSGRLFGNPGTGQFIVGPRITSGGGISA